MARGELGVDQRAAERDHAAKYPRQQKCGRARGGAGDGRRRLENQRADDHAGGEEHAVADRKELPGRAHRLAIQGTVRVLLPSEMLTWPSMRLPRTVPTK